MRVFELIGPIMFGPSSSHTAGACRLSRAMWQIMGDPIKKATLELHGSFRVREGDGVSTGGVVNKALVAGLLGFDTDDDRINSSHKLMEESGMDFSFGNTVIEGAHNNTVRFTIESDDFAFTATGASVGGGMIEVTDIDGMILSITGDYNTLLLFCKDANKVKAIAEPLLNKYDDLLVEVCTGGKRGCDLILMKTAYTISDEHLASAKAIDGVVHASRHLRFD